MIYPGQIYKMKQDNVSFFPSGDLFQIIEIKSSNKADVLHYDNCKIGSFEGNRRIVDMDSITCFAELVFDLKSLLKDKT